MDRKILLALFIIAGLVATVWLGLYFASVGSKEPRSEVDEDDDDFPFWLVPIWFVVVIPLLGKKEKKPEKSKWVIAAIVGAIVAVVIGLLVFLAFA